MGAKGELYTPDLKRSSQNQVWFRYRLAVSGTPSFKIYDFATTLVKTISGLGSQYAGEYTSRSRALFWDRTNGGVLAAGNYFVQLFVDGDLQDRITFILP